MTVITYNRPKQIEHQKGEGGGGLGECMQEKR